VVSVTSWVMAELVRVFHKLSTTEAQAMVDALVESRVPFVWKGTSVKRVLRTDLSLQEEILLLLAGETAPIPMEELQRWTGYEDAGYFRRLLRKLDKDRWVHYSDGMVEILPPGSGVVMRLIQKRA
jgi:hypothetical protein